MTEQAERAEGARGAGSLREEVGGGTYKTLEEQSGRISPAEERFERGRRTVGLFGGPVVFGVLLAVPLGLEANQQRLAAILGLVVVWWITEAIPIPVTGILGVVLCVVLEAVPPPEEGDTAADLVFGLFTDDTVFLFLGGFILAEAMVVHGLHRRAGVPRAVVAPGGRVDLPHHPGLRPHRWGHVADHVEHRRGGDAAADRAGRDGHHRAHGGGPG